MYRIGILGTENSHAAAFANLICRPLDDGSFRYPDFKVSALYAASPDMRSDRTPSEAIVSALLDACIKIYDDIEAMTGDVDCVMVTARHGKNHLPFALPFIKAGKPAFIDKPFTISPEDADELVAAAEDAKVPLCGGSGCKYSADIAAVKAEIENGAVGEVNSAVINFPADMKSEYGGFYFYASHLVEIMLELFGCSVKRVKAFERGGHLMAVARYDKYDIVMNFAGAPYYITVYGDRGNINRGYGIDGIYDAELAHFVHMVRTGISPLTAEQLITPVLVMNAIERSLAGGGETELR